MLVDKPDGGIRFCFDCRGLNKVVKRIAYPLPRTEEVLAALGGKKYFTTLDAASSFFALPLDEGSRHQPSGARQGSSSTSACQWATGMQVRSSRGSWTRHSAI